MVEVFISFLGHRPMPSGGWGWTDKHCETAVERERESYTEPPKIGVRPTPSSHHPCRLHIMPILGNTYVTLVRRSLHLSF